MTEQISPKTELENSRFEIKIEYRASKLPLVDLVKNLYDDLIRSDRSFFEEVNMAGMKANDLIFTIGHIGRGMEDFQKNITLKTSQSLSDNPKEIELTVPNLMKQISEQIKPYLSTHRYAQRNSEFFKAALQTFESIAERTENKKAKIRLEPTTTESVYEINSIELVNG